jgi:hypothetical protein
VLGVRTPEGPLWKVTATGGAVTIVRSVMGLPPKAERTPGSVDDLLRPSLGREHDADGAYPYSVRALVLTAFIGGPYALAGLLAFWAHRMNRLARDLVWLVVLAAVWTLALVLLARESAPASGPLVGLSLSALDRDFAIRHGGRVVALGFVGLYYLRHRQLYRALESLGRASPVATLPAIVCSVLGLALSGMALALLGVERGIGR